MALDLLADLPERVDLGHLRVAPHEASHHFVHPVDAYEEGKVVRVPRHRLLPPQAHPSRPHALTFPARGALPAALVLVELDEASDGFDDVSLGEKGDGEGPAGAGRQRGGLVPYRFIHDYDSGRAEPALRLHQGIEVHQHGLAHRLGEQRGGGAPRDDGQKVVPAPTDTPCQKRGGSG